jgi:ATP-dependent DNA ligase
VPRPIRIPSTLTFPSLPLPLSIPYPVMEANRQQQLPAGDHWLFEPKWDGFRCLVFRAGREVALQSKAGQSLSRYFPEMVQAFAALSPHSFILDGEIVIYREGRLSFDDLLLRIHPAASRITKLAKDTPATFMAFDLLYEPSHGGKLLVDRPLSERRVHLEGFFMNIPRDSLIRLSPATTDPGVAMEWLTSAGAIGCDGVMAKKIDERYHSGDRDAMIKIKRLKTADCVVGGFRYSATKDRTAIGSLLLGLYDEAGLLHHVGFTSSFGSVGKEGVRRMVEPLKGGKGFSGRAPGGPSRWSTSRTGEWEPLDPVLVCEVQYDHVSHHRFRHGTKFLRWRPEKKPKTCTFDQVELFRG